MQQLALKRVSTSQPSFSSLPLPRLPAGLACVDISMLYIIIISSTDLHSYLQIIRTDPWAGLLGSMCCKNVLNVPQKPIIGASLAPVIFVIPNNYSQSVGKSCYKNIFNCSSEAHNINRPIPAPKIL